MNISSSPEATEFSPEILNQIQNALDELTEAIVTNPILDTIENGNLTRPQWESFAIQRYLASKNFLSLLDSAIEKARNQNLYSITEVLESNLRDELGENLSLAHLGSHEKWRKDFYSSIGVNEEALQKAEYDRGSTHYYYKVQAIIQNGTTFETIGALLMLEFSIPQEFQKIQTGKNKTYPELLIQPTDSAVTRREKSSGLLYLKHHISHDANQHFPELLQSILPELITDTDLSDLLNGMKQICLAKQKFYSSLEQTILLTQPCS